MKQLVKILAKSKFVILFIVALLAVEAYSELAIPEYTSNIVNIGIQQSGVENGVPKQIRKSEMEKLLAFVSSEDREYVLSKYIAENDFYILKSIVSDEKIEVTNRLEDILGLPMVISFAMSNMTEESAISMDFSSLAGSSDDLPEGYVPDFSDPVVIGAVKEKLDALDSSIINQIAIQYITAEYKEIGVDIENMQMDYMKSAGAVMLMFALFSVVAAVSVSFLTSRIAAKFARNVRNAIFRKVLSFSNSEFDTFSTASMITRSTNDIQQMQSVIGIMLRMLIFAPFMGLGALYKIMRDSSEMGWVIGVAIGALFCLIIFLFTVALPKFQVLQKLVDRVNLVSREILTGLPVIRAFAKEEHEKKRFDAANINLMKVNLFVNRVMAIMLPTMFFIMNGVSVLIIWVGADTVNAGTMQVGDLIAFITYTMQIIMSFIMLSMMSIVLPRAIISYRRVGEVLDTEITVKDPEKPIKFNNSTKGYIEFKNVSFRYKNAEADVLKNINFKIEPGQTTAIIGSTGSGKSTLANLIPRFFDVTDGEILVDGINIKDVTLKDLRDKIGYVPQKAVLFSGTVKSNIGYSAVSAEENNEMDIERIIKAAETAQAANFINEREDKYDSAISQGGSNVSGGQKQRLSIARAIAKNPEIYIFDDSFSALDFKTDVALRKALTAITGDSTIIIVAQRISTILNCDRIIVLDEGEVVGVGKHKELLNSCDVYKDIAYSQLSAAELDIERGDE